MISVSSSDWAKILNQVFGSEGKGDIKVGTQIGTQKCAERAVEAVDAVHAVRIFLSKFSAC